MSSYREGNLGEEFVARDPVRFAVQTLLVLPRNLPTTRWSTTLSSNVNLFTLGPNVVQIWSRHPRISEAAKPS